MKNAQIIIFCIILACIICTVLIGILIYFMNKGKNAKTSIVRFTSSDDDIRYIQSDSPIYSDLSEPKVQTTDSIQEFSTSPIRYIQSDSPTYYDHLYEPKRQNTEPIQGFSTSRSIESV